MLILLGCDHRSAPISLRERLAFAEDRLTDALLRLLDREGICEGLILSTCNRVEVLARTDLTVEQALGEIQAFLCEECSVTAEDLERHSYRLQGSEAVRHLMQVATGLQSMVLGESQILGQVKQAYLVAKSCGATGPVLERLLQQSMATAKRTRKETGISRHTVSVAFAAVELARRIFGRLAGRRALLLGAGKMSELVAKHLLANGVSEIGVASRTYDHAVASAERFGGSAVSWEDGLGRLDKVDILVSCTGAAGAILTKREIATALRARRGEPLFLIDIAVPRDIDPQVNELDNVYLYDIDDLQGVVDANLEERRRAAREAERWITADVEAFDSWQRSLDMTPTIVALRERLLELGRVELERFRGRSGILSPGQELELEEYTRALIHKILHRPTVYLRRSVSRQDGPDCNSLYREIFGLDEETTPAPGEREDQHPTETDPRGPRRLIRGGKKG